MIVTTRRWFMAAAVSAALPNGACRARGHQVALKAWSTDEHANTLVAWAAERMLMLHDMRVRHVRIGDTAPADLVWLHDPRHITRPRLILPWPVTRDRSYLVIPSGAARPDAARALARFLLSPETRAHAAELGWTDYPTTDWQCRITR